MCICKAISQGQKIRECPDFGVLCPAGGDATIRTLEFVSNNFVERISKKAKKMLSKDLKNFPKTNFIQNF
jgi:hypothetical protein